jgi:hypothetical protein
MDWDSLSIGHYYDGWFYGDSYMLSRFHSLFILN